jgi:hypothetical protein
MIMFFKTKTSSNFTYDGINEGGEPNSRGRSGAEEERYQPMKYRGGGI